MGCSSSTSAKAKSSSTITVIEPAERRFLTALRQCVDDDGAVSDTAERNMVKLMQKGKEETLRKLSGAKGSDRRSLNTELEAWKSAEQSARAKVPTATEMANAATALELQKAYFECRQEAADGGEVSDAALGRMLACLASDVEGQDRVHGTRMAGPLWKPYSGIAEAEAHWRAWFALAPAFKPELPELHVKVQENMMVFTEYPERMVFGGVRSVQNRDGSPLIMQAVYVFNGKAKVESVVMWYDKRCRAGWELIGDQDRGTIKRKSVVASPRSSMVQAPAVKTKAKVSKCPKCGKDIGHQTRPMPQKRFSIGSKITTCELQFKGKTCGHQFNLEEALPLR